MYNPNTIYHIYNQSINYELLFRTDANYRYFLEKLKRHVLPHADVLAFCLMPDHFHLLLKPTVVGCEPGKCGRYLRLTETGEDACFQQNLSSAIKTTLSSYTQAINKRHGRRGSLFKAKTKAKPGYKGFSPEELGLDTDDPLTQKIPYLRTCFNYIHANPVKSNHVNHPEEWEFSSALDYAGYRDCGLINFTAAEQLLGIVRKNPYSGPTG
ncbi:transposase [Lewinella sp. JB7]|uniref:transposase n=1 Tax=Lewinella sp. JB7 TaxID=2962887 RepID=UPI0020C9A577|nr:transposase [Lewinella sp. JB7]MCP9235588.1 transposase [Lewinella sp. JB7]